MEALYDYIFWYNHHEEIWYAIERDTQLDFFRGNRENSKYYKSNTHSTLVEIITKPKLLAKLEGK
jgi:hypothetical protein